MWIMTSETFHDEVLPEDSTIFYRLLSFKNYLDEVNPDEIIVFDTFEDAEAFDVDEYLSDFDWDGYKERYAKIMEEEERRQNV